MALENGQSSMVNSLPKERGRTDSRTEEQKKTTMGAASSMRRKKGSVMGSISSRIETAVMRSDLSKGECSVTKVDTIARTAAS